MLCEFVELTLAIHLQLVWIVEILHLYYIIPSFCFTNRTNTQFLTSDCKIWLLLHHNLQFYLDIKSTNEATVLELVLFHSHSKITYFNNLNNNDIITVLIFSVTYQWRVFFKNRVQHRYIFFVHHCAVDRNLICMYNKTCNNWMILWFFLGELLYNNEISYQYICGFTVCVYCLLLRRMLRFLLELELL